MADIIEGVKALDFNPDLVLDPISVDSSRAVKVSTLFVDKIDGLYTKAASAPKVVEKVEVKEEIEEEPIEKEIPVVEKEEIKEPVKEVKVEEPVKNTESIIDPDGMLSDIASSFEAAVAQIHAKQAELDVKELDVARIKGELVIKEEKTNKLLTELEKMKKDVEVSKKEADKIIREAELKDKELQKRIDAFEQERQRFLSNLRHTTGSIMDMVGDKKTNKED